MSGRVTDEVVTAYQEAEKKYWSDEANYPSVEFDSLRAITNDHLRMEREAVRIGLEAAAPHMREGESPPKADAVDLSDACVTALEYLASIPGAEPYLKTIREELDSSRSKP